MGHGRAKAVLACVAGAGILVAACADIFGIHGGVLDDAGVDGAIDAPIDYVTHDAIDLDVNTGICEGGVPFTPGQAAWVSQNKGTDDGTCGTQLHPCATITYTLANVKKPLLYLDDSVFIEPLALGVGFSNYTIQGGFQIDDAGTWTPSCNTQLTTIQGPEDAASAAVDINGAAGITFRLMTVKSKVNGAPGTGESVYAMRVTDTQNVTLDNVTLLAQSGGAGQVGTGGSAGSGFQCTGAGSASTGANGAPSGGGHFNAQGFVPDIAGNGDAGDLGVPQPGKSGQCVASCFGVCGWN